MSDRLRERQRHVAFRGMVAEVANELTEEEAQTLAAIYDERRSFKNPLDLAMMLVQQNSIQNTVSDLTLFGESLARAKRNDLQRKVSVYLKRNQLPRDVPDPIPPPLQPIQFPPQPMVTSTASLGTDEENHDSGKSKVVSLSYRHHLGTKRRRVETSEERDLEDAANAIEIIQCDSTSDSSDEAGENMDEEATPEDKEYMKQAQQVALESKDDQTKVGAVLVDRATGAVVGRGCNRMPEGCEGRFQWDRDRKKQKLDEGKHLYVVYAIRAAIFNAYKNKADPAGCTLYTTLYPSNICAQCIRDAGIKEVVYISDKFHKTKFMKASRRIMEGIPCRQYNDKDLDAVNLKNPLTDDVTKLTAFKPLCHHMYRI